MAICPTCGSDIPKNSAFCHQCGTKIEQPPQRPRQQQAPQENRERREPVRDQRQDREDEQPRQMRQGREMQDDPPRQQYADRGAAPEQGYRQQPQRDDIGARRDNSQSYQDGGYPPRRSDAVPVDNGYVSDVRRRREDYDDEPPVSRPRRNQQDVRPVTQRSDYELDPDEDVLVDDDGNEIGGRKRGGLFKGMAEGVKSKLPRSPFKDDFDDDGDEEQGYADDDDPRFRSRGSKAARQMDRAKEPARPQQKEAPRPPQDAPRMAGSASMNELCIVALVLGVLGTLNLIAAIVAIVISGKATDQAYEYGQQGQTLAKCGRILGIISVVLWALAILGTLGLSMSLRALSLPM